MKYTGDFLQNISFPLGGIGTGSLGLAGNGSFWDWEIFGRPNKGSFNRYSHIAVRVQQGENTVCKVLQSDITHSLSGTYQKSRFEGFGFGPATLFGLPHFEKCTFDGRFPVAELTFEDEKFPGSVLLRAFNPFIPLDSHNSSIPAAFFEVIYRNDTEKELEFQCAFSLSSPFKTSVTTVKQNGNISALQICNAVENKEDMEYGDLSLSSADACLVQACWDREVWTRGLTEFWDGFADGTLAPREYKEPGQYDTGTVLHKRVLAPGEQAVVRYVLSWNVPNCCNYWHVKNAFWEEESEKLGAGLDTPWKHYYATVFADSFASGLYSLQNWDMLWEKTRKFREELYASTVDEAVLDAVSANLSVLHSPTVLRLQNGEFYGFEGSHEQSGCCQGTCQHVYNYAYALCFLFPDLERSIRELEFRYATYEDGAMGFRLQLPLGARPKNFRTCLDGQMGAVFKTYREWKISGDDAWLKANWPHVIKVLEYAWSPENPCKWDADADGVLEGMQHHTLDVEMFGPSGWLQGMYFAALAAAAEMAEYLGDAEKADRYKTILQKGRAWVKEHLFNGEYFIHKLDLADASVPAAFGKEEIYWREDLGQTVFQIGQGSSIDQLCGQWHANILGLGELFDADQRKKALESMWKYNFKASLRDHVNVWRVFALNDEAGAIICAYPKHVERPKLPILYKDECMTGFEYQFAGLLISEGFVEEGLQLVRAVRDRYDGKKRNPWNELECGSNYARSMASFALLPIFSGMEFHLPVGHIGFSPVEKNRAFRCLWSLGTGWGSVSVSENSSKITLASGHLLLKSVKLPNLTDDSKLLLDGEQAAFVLKDGCAVFSERKVTKSIEIC